MRKYLLSLILFGMLFVLCACGNDIKNEDSNNKTELKEEIIKFDDLTMSRMLGSFDDVWVDFPNWRENGSENCTVVESYNNYIIGVISMEEYSFDELFKMEVKPNLKHFVENGTYEDFVAESSEEVNLSNGIKATKFDGKLSMDSYGTLYEYPVYGYYFKFNNYSIMMMSVATDTKASDSEVRRLEANKYVDEIVQTIRNSK